MTEQEIAKQLLEDKTCDNCLKQCTIPDIKNTCKEWKKLGPFDIAANIYKAQAKALEKLSAAVSELADNITDFNHVDDDIKPYSRKIHYKKNKRYF